MLAGIDHPSGRNKGLKNGWPFRAGTIDGDEFFPPVIVAVRKPQSGGWQLKEKRMGDVSPKGILKLIILSKGAIDSRHIL